MSGTEIIIAPGSGRPLTRSLLDKNNQPVDFTTGTWRADLFIVEYPGASGTPFAKLSSVTEVGSLRWLSLNNDSSVTVTPDPLVTSGWDFYKYHYELYIQGPNAQSKTERIDHGPFRLDR
jgi:hypothetical protein